MNTKPLKLYVWEDESSDAACDIMFALASSVDEARDLIMERENNGTFAKPMRKVFGSYMVLHAEPKVFESPIGYVVYGAEAVNHVLP